VTVDFWESDPLAEHRDAARAWADANVRPEWVDEQRRTGTHETLELHALLARDGILGAGWPPEYGGTDVDPDYARAVYQELSYRGLEAHGRASTMMIIRTIQHVAGEDQKREYLSGALRGEMMMALGYSEPDSGSDVAAATTSAVRDGDEWVINGQKMFTSTAQVCSHVFLLTRTNPDVPKHKGLTMFVVPTDSPGYEIQPIHTLGGQRTNATFYTNVRVPDSARIGGVDAGWSVMNVALTFERGGATGSALEHTLSRDLAAWARDARRPDGTAVLDDPLTAERIGRMAVDEEVTRVLGLRVLARAQKNELPQVEGAMRKVFATEALQRHYSDTLDILGADGVLSRGAPDAPGGGRFEAEFRAAVVETIYGGSSEIMREIVAERHLGLPRNRPSR
jgi:3-oxocholest-4-en-26-oyl-CoA dehydrogenase alpha subunit